jgi:glyoxylase-like metal-dependent hydrolase (beta-lactamase superfamily II)
MLPDYPFATPPAAGETLEVAPGIHWLRMPLPFALDHINLWLLADESDGRPGWTIIDTGFALPKVKALGKILANSPQRRVAAVTRIIITHFHPDHLGLATGCRETGALSI